MKKILLAMFTLVAGISLSVSNLYAYPVLGTVDPGFSTGYNLKTSETGTVTYYFRNRSTGSYVGYKLIELELTFEGDVFDLNNNNTTLNSSTLPAGWSSDPDSDGGYTTEIFSGPGIPEGGLLSFKVDFTLLGDALTLDPLWDEGGYWKQGLVAKFESPDGTRTKLYGGSTVPIPEPGTMVMLGISILSLAGYGKMRLEK